ncbi:MAG: HD domain-containing protein [Sedimenticola sp.]|nr:HD domain-containing protein [Sedimenticola sp.]
MWSQDKYIAAWNFSTASHNGQLLPGTDLPYINHIANVAMEVMSAIARQPTLDEPNLSIQCALLHDTLEDTEVTYDELVTRFGASVSEGVLALTKNKQLPTKQEQMADSLARIQQQSHEIWIVKLADRITNLHTPPGHWSKEKIRAYRAEAITILDTLGASHEHLAERLKSKIDAYQIHC